MDKTTFEPRIRNGGHGVTTTKILNEYDLSPDNITNHINIHRRGDITRQLLESIAQMIEIHKTPNIQYLPSSKHWREIEQTKRGTKWATKVKKALKQIRAETEGD